ncbi:hypothetical protein AAG570_002550 [Ranatra chinensis]|uniref:Tyrosinase copper-binding domain-containing protein n=1 Tax=Ranatra chinensis TaxID=642074 RepID=A0ABD0Y7W5_9HEMI
MKFWTEGDQVEEYRVSYFREDPELNDLFARWHMHWPSWFNPTKYGQPEWNHRGEIFYYFHQQILARYVLERYANCLPTVETLEWTKPIRAGYNPNLIDMKGNYMFTRPDHVNIKDFFPYGVSTTGKIERWLIDSTDSKAYVAFVSGATGNILTTMRDPVFYQFLQRMNKFVHRYKTSLPPYSIKELGCHGVKINSIEVGKLTTFFEPFEYDASYGLGIGPREDKEKLHYVASGVRLNREPFTMKFKITSDETAEVMVRVFIGPKYDSEGQKMTLEQSRLAYFEIDRFPVEREFPKGNRRKSSQNAKIYQKLSIEY